MNNEVIKAMNRKPKEKSKLRKWWDKHRIKILRIVLFPIWLWIIINDKLTNLSSRRNKWNEARAKQIFDYYIPRRADWCADENEFYFFDNGYGWSINFAKKHLKRKDRAFWKHNVGWCGGKMRDYLINNFELEGFTKEVINSDGGWTEISFNIN